MVGIPLAMGSVVMTPIDQPDVAQKSKFSSDDEWHLAVNARAWGNIYDGKNQYHSLSASNCTDPILPASWFLVSTGNIAVRDRNLIVN